MNYYGGTITVKGRDLITSLLAGDEIEFTKVEVGSGMIPEGVEPIDMEALVEYVADATSTIPTTENGEVLMTVEYRNDMNGGLKEGFWLREFGVFAKSSTHEECLLYYATLGDSPQPVNAYQDNRIDIRRYPITIALELDADVQVSYNPGAFITGPDAERIIREMLEDHVCSTAISEITIPASAWTFLEEPLEYEGDEPYFLVQDVACEGATEEHFPNVALTVESLTAAKDAGVCPTCEALNGVLRFWAQNTPTRDLHGVVSLLAENTAKSDD